MGSVIFLDFHLLCQEVPVLVTQSCVQVNYLALKSLMTAEGD